MIILLSNDIGVKNYFGLTPLPAQNLITLFGDKDHDLPLG